MPRSKIGHNRIPLDMLALEKAVNAVLKNKVPIRRAAKNYGISNTTLQRHLKKHNSKINKEESFVYESKTDAKKVFDYEQEVELSLYLKHAAKLHYGLTKKEVLKLAYEYAKGNNLATPDNWEHNKAAGKMWLRGFRKRFPSLTLRKPEATSLARATSFNKENVEAFFENLKTLMAKHKFAPSIIYNLDETGNSTVHVPPKVICARGTKQVGSVTSGERGINVTLIVAVNAIGNHVPAMLIFPRVHFKDHMLIGAPSDSIGGANPTGWSTEALFVKYLQHFISHVKPTKDNPVLLILDNHETHMSLEAITVAKANGVVMLTLPPHTSHKMQPLDRGVFGPYKTFYNTRLNEWMLQHPGMPASIYDLGGVIGQAFNKAVIKENIETGFRVTGIFPLNENIFKGDEFLSSYVTDRPQNVSTTDAQMSSGINNGLALSIKADMTLRECSLASKDVSEKIVPGCGKRSDKESSATSPVSPQMIWPFPKAPPRKTTVRKQKGKTRILTDTPEKNEIEQRKCKKVSEEKEKGRKVFKKARGTEKRRLIDDSSSDDNGLLLSNIVDDPSDEDLMDIVNNEEHEMNDEIQFENFLNEKIGKGDYILVKVCGKKRICYFIAQVVNVLPDDEYEVIYFKTIANTNRPKFCVEKDDVYVISSDDIEKKLPLPVCDGHTKRQMHNISFSVDFTHYNLQ